MTALLRFPCPFPVKALGLDSAALESVVRAVVERHARGERVEYVGRRSGGGKYLCITATFRATSREQLDALYAELNGHELVVMTL